MAKILKYIEPVPKKNGKVYFYFRRHGKRTPLPGAYNSPEFLEAYWALRNGDAAKIEIGAERTLLGTVNAAVIAFYKHRRFTKNQPITQKNDRNILEAFRAKHGDKRIARLEHITSRHCSATRLARLRHNATCCGSSACCSTLPSP
jgi:hypothetical protein